MFPYDMGVMIIIIIKHKAVKRRIYIYKTCNKISGEERFSNIIEETDGRGGVGRQGRGSDLGLPGR